MLQGAPAWTWLKRPEHPGNFLVCFCYLSVFGPKSDKIEGKHMAAFASHCFYYRYIWIYYKKQRNNVPRNNNMDSH